MAEAKREEIRRLLKRKTFKVILQEKVPPNATIFPWRFVLAVKSTKDGKVKFKSGYAIDGHRDRMKDVMVHDAATLQPQSVRLLLALAEMHNFDIWTSDVRKAYLQSSEPLSREFFSTKPRPRIRATP